MFTRPSFEEAMDWWKSQDAGVSTIIRMAAMQALEHHNIPGNGIGSSDINHGVFNLFCSFKAAMAAPVVERRPRDVVDFCLDYIQDF